MRSFDDVEINPACRNAGRVIERRFVGYAKKAASTASCAGHGSASKMRRSEVRCETLSRSAKS